MSPLDTTHLTEPPPENRSRLDVDEPGSWHEAMTTGSDLLGQRSRPIVADPAGVGPWEPGRCWRPGPNGHRGWVVVLPLGRRRAHDRKPKHVRRQVCPAAAARVTMCMLPVAHWMVNVSPAIRQPSASRLSW
jgi:hypothetical protein